MIFNKFKKTFEIIYMTGQCEQKESQTTSEMGNPCTNFMANPHTRNNM